jgi:transcriptional regulator with PAS, ATPase and Fis domain
LPAEIAQGHFREDLFYRVAVGIISLPPLRERQGDIALLSAYLLQKINQDAVHQPDYVAKTLSVKAKNKLLNYDWPGNIRELQGVLLRASIWSEERNFPRESASLGICLAIA